MHGVGIGLGEKEESGSFGSGWPVAKGPSFLKKRSKKLLITLASCCGMERG
jgi:hypothetical protein